MCEELTMTSIPCVLVLLRGRRQRKSGAKLSPGRREGWGKVLLRSGFIFSLPYSDLIGDKLSSLFSPSSVCFVCDCNW